jgi:hypothetical protein
MLDDNLTQTIQIMGSLCVCVWIAWLCMNDDDKGGPR